MVLAAQDFPPDVRVEREARALLGAGHEILILCDGMIPGRPLLETWEGCRIARLPPWPNVPRKLLGIWQDATFSNPRWFAFIDRILNEGDIDALHVHDLPMIGPALKLARRHGVPLVADLHENYPFAKAEYVQGRALGRRLSRLIYRKKAWEAYERRCCETADHILATVEESRDRIIELGTAPDKITVIQNTVDVDEFLAFPPRTQIMDAYRDDFMISYIGGFGSGEKGMDIVIRAMPEILSGIPNAKLVLVGRGHAKDDLVRLSRSLNLDDRVEFIDWRPFAEIPSYISASTVCLMPFLSNGQHDACSPNKLFQCMLMEKPILANKCRSVARMVTESNCGVIYDADVPASLVQAILTLQDPELRRKYGEAGKSAVLRHYNWAETAKSLILAYGNLGSGAN